MSKHFQDKLNKLHSFYTWKEIASKLSLSIYQLYRIRKFNSKPRNIDLTSRKVESKLVLLDKQRKKKISEKVSFDVDSILKVEPKKKRIFKDFKSKLIKNTKRYRDKYYPVSFVPSFEVFARNFGKSLVDKVNKETDVNVMLELNSILDYDLKEVYKEMKEKNLDMLFIDVKILLDVWLYNSETRKKEHIKKEISRKHFGFNVTISEYDFKKDIITLKLIFENVVLEFIANIYVGMMISGNFIQEQYFIKQILGDERDYMELISEDSDVILNKIEYKMVNSTERIKKNGSNN